MCDFMDKVAYMILLFVLGFFSVSRASHYIFTSQEELYSNYRNTIDVSPSHFKRYLLTKRVLWIVLSLLFLLPAFYMFFN